MRYIYRHHRTLYYLVIPRQGISTSELPDTAYLSLFSTLNSFEYHALATSTSYKRLSYLCHFLNSSSINNLLNCISNFSIYHFIPHIDVRLRAVFMHACHINYIPLKFVNYLKCFQQILQNLP